MGGLRRPPQAAGRPHIGIIRIVSFWAGRDTTSLHRPAWPPADLNREPEWVTGQQRLVDRPRTAPRCVAGHEDLDAVQSRPALKDHRVSLVCAEGRPQPV